MGVESDQIAGALAEARHRVQGHGGDIEWVYDADERVVRVRLVGRCVGCPVLPVTYVSTVRSRLLQLDAVDRVELANAKVSEHVIRRVESLYADD